MPVARDMVVDSMDDGVIVLDAQRRLVDLNAAAERYTGCTAMAASAAPIDEVVAWWNDAVAEDRPLVRQASRRSSRSNRGRAISR